MLPPHFWGHLWPAATGVLCISYSKVVLRSICYFSSFDLFWFLTTSRWAVRVRINQYHNINQSIDRSIKKTNQSTKSINKITSNQSIKSVIQSIKSVIHSNKSIRSINRINQSNPSNQSTNRYQIKSIN